MPPHAATQLDLIIVSDNARTDTDFYGKDAMLYVKVQGVTFSMKIKDIMANFAQNLGKLISN